MTYDSTRDFQIALEKLPELPAGEHGDWYHVVKSPWLDGVFHRDRQDPDTTVTLRRMADNEPGTAESPWLCYEIAVGLSATKLTMSPEAAIKLGRYLIEAGACAVRDLGKHAWFLAASSDDRAHRALEAPW